MTSPPSQIFDGAASTDAEHAIAAAELVR